MQGLDVADVESARVRRAGRDVLSLALMDARNRTLRWAAAFEAAGQTAPEGAARGRREDTAVWQLGHLGWYQEYWIARNVQRQRGERGDASHPKLASILPPADRLFDPVHAAQPWAADDPVPDLQTLRQYLVETLEPTLELLEVAHDTDESLYFYRLALLREDAAGERFAQLAQTLGVAAPWLVAAPARVQRAPLLFAATRWSLGSVPGGLVPDAEKWAHPVALPEFEIDSQVVNWAQFGEFVQDGGYDDPAHWSAPGWAWVQAQGRRTPRHVDQMRQGVLVRRFGKLVRAPQAHPAVHVSWFEADAWCRWAGRRLPSEAEWEAAAVLGAARGWRWGDVREWTAGTLQPYPGAGAASPGQRSDEFEADPSGRVQRGASFATALRLHAPQARWGVAAHRDEGFSGFRSCAM